MSDGKFGGKARFKIFRGVEAPGLEESGVEKHEPGQPLPPASVLETLADMQDPGYSHRVLFAEQGMSLLHLWFKSGFVLPRHSHDTDCVYFIVAGTMRIGAAHLGPGDGFFVGAQVPYTYTRVPRRGAVLSKSAGEKSRILDEAHRNDARGSVRVAFRAAAERKRRQSRRRLEP